MREDRRKNKSNNNYPNKFVFFCPHRVFYPHRASPFLPFLVLSHFYNQPCTVTTLVTSATVATSAATQSNSLLSCYACLVPFLLPAKNILHLVSFYISLVVTTLVTSVTVTTSTATQSDFLLKCYACRIPFLPPAKSVLHLVSFCNSLFTFLLPP